MRSSVLFRTKRDLATLALLLFSTLVSAQEYNFTFYNGDVVQEKQPDEKGEEQSGKPLPAKNNETTLEKRVEPSNEKIKRTGLSLITGYSHNNFKNSDGLFGHLDNKAFRVGLSFISSYDFNLDLEFISNSIDGSLNGGENSIGLNGRIPGIAIGVRNNYWLTDSFALSLGGNVKGVKGSLNSSEGEYAYESYGGSLSAGPVFQVGKVQIQLAYEYGLNNVQIRNKNENMANSEWTQNSALKGILSYRF